MRVALVLTVALAGSFALVGRAARAEFQAAAGKVDITPTRPVYIAGYGENRRSTGAHDPLWARCLIVRSAGEPVALVTCDLLGIARYHAQRIRKLIRRVPPERVLIGVTHTHSGPDTYGQWGPDPKTSGVDQAWMAELYTKIAALVDQTAGALKAASVRYGAAEGIQGCSYNARVREILDTELDAMQVVGADGKTVASLINYACHPEILNNHQLTSDFPHWLRQTVEEKIGGIAIYANGAQGGMVTADIHDEAKYPKGEAWPEAERIGRTLGGKALDALASAPLVADPAVTFAQRTFRVPLESALFKELLAAGVLPGDLVVDGEIETEVTRFTIGPAEFLTLPGEVLPNIGLYLKRRMTGRPHFLLGLTGDALGYILTPEDYGLQLYRYESSVSVGPQMGRRMEENLLKLLNAKDEG